MASEVALVALRLAVSARRAVRMTVASVVTLAPVTCATSVRWKLTRLSGVVLLPTTAVVSGRTCVTSLADVLLLPVNPAARLRAWVTVLVGVALLPVRAASSARNGREEGGGGCGRTRACECGKKLAYCRHGTGRCTTDTRDARRQEPTLLHSTVCGTTQAVQVRREGAPQSRNTGRGGTDATNVRRQAACLCGQALRCRTGRRQGSTESALEGQAARPGPYSHQPRYSSGCAASPRTGRRRTDAEGGSREDPQCQEFGDGVRRDAGASQGTGETTSQADDTRRGGTRRLEGHRQGAHLRHQTRRRGTTPGEVTAQAAEGGDGAGWGGTRPAEARGEHTPLREEHGGGATSPREPRRDSITTGNVRAGSS